MRVREAILSDAERCSVVLCASIRDLCIPDHRGDEKIISRWLVNKTPQILKGWIRSSRGTFFVSEVDDEIAGVGAISDSDEIMLNYVSPTHRFMGVSRAILSELEAALRHRGVANAKLTST